jgi:hypothetical protein
VRRDDAADVDWAVRARRIADLARADGREELGGEERVVGLIERAEHATVTYRWRLRTSELLQLGPGLHRGLKARFL